MVAYEMTTDIIQSCPLLRDAKYDERNVNIAQLSIQNAAVREEINLRFILHSEPIAP